MKILKAMCAAAVALSLVGCAQTSSSDDKLTKVTLMLDYTPNTNHTGFYVATATFNPENKPMAPEGIFTIL